MSRNSHTEAASPDSVLESSVADHSPPARTLPKSGRAPGFSRCCQTTSTPTDDSAESA
jgi:hypothetical protein